MPETRSQGLMTERKYRRFSVRFQQAFCSCLRALRPVDAPSTSLKAVSKRKLPDTETQIPVATGNAGPWSRWAARRIESCRQRCANSDGDGTCQSTSQVLQHVVNKHDEDVKRGNDHTAGWKAEIVRLARRRNTKERGLRFGSRTAAGDRKDHRHRRWSTASVSPRGRYSRENVERTRRQTPSSIRRGAPWIAEPWSGMRPAPASVESTTWKKALTLRTETDHTRNRFRQPVGSCRTWGGRAATKAERNSSRSALFTTEWTPFYEGTIDLELRQDCWWRV